jgi:hypothetical protein
MDAFYASVEQRDNPELRGTHFWANTYAERYRPALGESKAASPDRRRTIAAIGTAEPVKGQNSRVRLAYP